MNTVDDIVEDKGTEVSYMAKDDKQYEVTMKRISRAWECISTPEFSQKSQQSSIDNGEGINVYRFLRSSDTTDKGNCTYYYADKGCTLWNAIVGGMNNRAMFDKMYQHTNSYLVAVSVPVDGGDENAQSLRMFQYDTNKEIEF